MVSAECEPIMRVLGWAPPEGSIRGQSVWMPNASSVSIIVYIFQTDELNSKWDVTNPYLFSLYKLIGFALIPGASE